MVPQIDNSRIDSLVVERKRKKTARIKCQFNYN